jgi:transcriptional regulator with XRE-family HTH domain
MPQRERDICERLKQFRTDSGLSQSEFARLCGLKLRAYASYEYAHSQLNYPAAWKILTTFPLLNPAWLAGENASREYLPVIIYPTAADLEYGPRTPFSSVYNGKLKALIANSQPLFGANLSCPFLVSKDACGRVVAKEMFGEIMGNWLPRVPNRNLNTFLNEAYRRCSELFSKLHDDSDLAAVSQLARQMKKIAFKRRLVFLGNFAVDDPKKDLQGDSLKGNTVEVASKIQKLIEQVKRKALKPGAKAELARKLRVAPARISEWLAGDKEPGGNYTLKLQNWVEQQER